MHHFSHLAALAYISGILRATNAQTNGIELRDKMEELEHLWVDSNGTNFNGFMNGVSPCSKYIGFTAGGDDLGEQTSAEWVRLSFHDFVTANKTTGLGGLDASIAFEADRFENAGIFINDTLSFYIPTVSAYLSMSDNIALGVVASVARCGGSSSGIPPRVGRIDAVTAGPAGVPQPSTDLETTLAQFAAAGFTQTETIGVTACGHSLGRVHHANFPDIVPASYVTDTNTLGGEDFDATPAVFDANVVNEYLNATGQRGGPLVTAASVANRSDYRLYISDQNVTMQGLSEASEFQSKCNTLFQHLIETVPAAVTLSDPITPMTWKGVDLLLDISSAGIVSISGLIRHLYTTTTPPSTVDYTTTSSGVNSTVKKTDTTSGNGSSVFGSTIYWPFNSTITSPGTTSLNFEDITYPVNDEIFVLPAQSTVDNTTDTYVLRAAALTSLVSEGESMTGVFYVPTIEGSSLTRAIKNTTVAMTSYGTAGNYTLFEAEVTTNTTVAVVVKVLLGDAASKTVQTKIFG